MNILVVGFPKTESRALQVLLERKMGATVLQRPEGDRPPTCIVFNPDYAGGMDIWRSLQQRFPHVPTICISNQARQLRGVVCLQRPLQADDLIEILKKHLGQSAAACGETTVIPPACVTAVSCFDLRTCLAGLLRKAELLLHEGEAHVLLSGPFKLLMRQNGEVISTLSERSLYALGSTRARGLTFELIPIKDDEVDRLLAQMSREARLYHFRREAFLWHAAVLSSHGQLPEEMGLNEKLSLVSWPDCTRLEAPHHILPVVSVLAQGPCSPMELAEATGRDLTEIAEVLTALYVASHVRIGTSDGEPRRTTRVSGSLSGVLSRLAQRMATRLFGRTMQITRA